MILSLNLYVVCSLFTGLLVELALWPDHIKTRHVHLNGRLSCNSCSDANKIITFLISRSEIFFQECHFDRTFVNNDRRKLAFYRSKNIDKNFDWWNADFLRLVKKNENSKSTEKGKNWILSSLGRGGVRGSGPKEELSSFDSIYGFP